MTHRQWRVENVVILLLLKSIDLQIFVKMILILRML